MQAKQKSRYQSRYQGGTSMTDTKPSENDSILMTKITQTTVAEEIYNRFWNLMKHCYCM